MKDFVVIAHVGLLGRCAFWESVPQAVVRWKSVRRMNFQGGGGHVHVTHIVLDGARFRSEQMPTDRTVPTCVESGLKEIHSAGPTVRRRFIFRDKEA